jgi:hypothetical protein
MINFEKINQLATALPTNTRMPLNPIIHQLAFDDHSLKLLSSCRDTHNHIAFLVIQPVRSDLLRKALFQSVHCIIVKGVGVILSSTCSSITEVLLENFAKWAPYLKVKEDVQYYWAINSNP